MVIRSRLERIVDVEKLKDKTVAGR